MIFVVFVLKEQALCPLLRERKERHMFQRAHHLQMCIYTSPPFLLFPHLLYISPLRHPEIMGWGPANPGVFNMNYIASTYVESSLSKSRVRNS